jgi:hypothetical protein
MAAAETERPRFIAAEAFARALADVGIIQDPERIARIVIDVQAGCAVVMHVQHLGDERLLKVAQSLEGIEVSSVPAGCSDGR